MVPNKKERIIKLAFEGRIKEAINEAEDVQNKKNYVFIMHK